MDVRYLGHSATEVSTGDSVVVIDPFISGNALATASADELAPTHIVLTHAHADHVGDTEAIARRTGALIISSFEIINHFAAKDLAGHPMNPGGSYVFPFGRLKFTPAWHSSSFADGSYGGMPMGVVIDDGDKRIYHAGDTALFSDMALIAKPGLDLALLPIGDNFTMGPEDALEAVKLLQAATVVPIHYNTFELIKQDAHAFKAAVEQQTSSRCLVLEPGERTNV